MKISVVVGTYNRLAQLKGCVQSILAQTQTPVRVYVTDAGSTDGTVEYLQSIASETVIPILVGEKLGQARAYNEVFAQIETPYVCWLSDDNVLVNRGLDVAAQILDEHPCIGMVALKVKDKLGPFVNAPYVGGVSIIGILNVNQGILRTPIMAQVGGFSETFRDYGIDPDLTAKVLFSGHAIVYTRAVAIHHYRNWSTDSASQEYAQQRAKQQVYLELYQQKYAAFAKGGIGARMKKFAWLSLRATLGISINSARPFLGLIARDWHNLFTSRYISLLDPVRCWGQPYYLLQYCPPYRVRMLPADPEPVTAER